MSDDLRSRLEDEFNRVDYASEAHMASDMSEAIQEFADKNALSADVLSDGELLEVISENGLDEAFLKHASSFVEDVISATEDYNDVDDDPNERDDPAFT